MYDVYDVLYGTCVWYVCMVCVVCGYGVRVWYVCLSMFVYGVSVCGIWCICVHVHGVYAVCVL